MAPFSRTTIQKLCGHFVRLLCLCLIMCQSAVSLTSKDKPSDSFNQFYVFTPRILIDNITDVNVKFIDGANSSTNTSIRFSYFQADFILDLEKNAALLSENFFQSHQKDGKIMVEHPYKTNTSHCFYRGQLRGNPGSWASMSTCNGLSGVFFDGTELHYVEPHPNSTDIESSHFVYKHLHLKPGNQLCAHNIFQTNWKPVMSKTNNEMYPSARDDLPSSTTENTSRIVELVLVADHQLFLNLNSDMRATYTRLQIIANVVSSLYEPLGISIHLLGVIVWNEQDVINIVPNIRVTVSNFLHYQNNFLMQAHPNDNAQLLSGFAFSEGALGKVSEIGDICSGHSVGVEMDDTVAGLVAITVAHELGHNLGMEHDDDFQLQECTCPNDRCIMRSYPVEAAPVYWSACSVDREKKEMNLGNHHCLFDVAVRNESYYPLCGNGILDDEEVCECGPGSLPNIPCFILHSEFCQNCRIESLGIECRSAIDECDLPEYYGDFFTCSHDLHKEDGRTCLDGSSLCFNGRCNSHKNQCDWRDVNYNCFEKNQLGIDSYNCGYLDEDLEIYKPCLPGDELCGSLHCSVVPGLLLCNEFNFVSGMVANGAGCGDGKVCIDQSCTPMSTLNQTDCARRCTRGVCDQFGDCHCGPYGSDNPPYCKDLRNGEVGDVDYTVFMVYLLLIAMVALL